MRVRRAIAGLWLAARVMASGVEPGQDHEIGELGIVMKWIPPGLCQVGSGPYEQEWTDGPEGQGNRKWFANEGPSLAYFESGFWLGQTEVTIEQWQMFVAGTGYVTDGERQGFAWGFDWQLKTLANVDGANWRQPTYGLPLRPDHPVSCVSWNDAMAFCEWLTAREAAAGRLPEGYEYRLPGDAEWEYACRGGQGDTRFWWGNSLAGGEGRLNAAGDDVVVPGDPAWRWNNPFPWSDGYGFIAPVDAYGERGRNGFGLADMLGNLWEWCYDGYDHHGAHARIYMKGTSNRLLRGGAFDDRPAFLRCAVRQAPAPEEANFARGFRVCLGSPP
ncbi:MAG TPA: SUMF1/EgtB/PvdO family nonheme iron enzyme [Kiritimatiellia bacterium]|nr:SUMF1/EgtB/PvdO family nonheme iron enzyme [Kiritimatiellia bacterium]HSA17445.1 SUMF1/EgtB/PvdO family nonheme iron enzyme [Kiritimatiellia bacterium]